MDWMGSSISSEAIEWLTNNVESISMNDDTETDDSGYASDMETPDVTRNQIIAIVLSVAGQAGALTAESDAVKIAAFVCFAVVLCVLLLSDAMIRGYRAKHLSTYSE